MANGHGGYRQPTNPSPVSGPGALSQRTDGPLHGPVPGAGPAGPGAEQAVVGGPDLASVVPMGAESQHPEQPITAGLPGGLGAGPSLPPPGGLNERTAERLRSYLPVLVFMASQPDADPASKQFVRQLRGELG